MTTATIARPRYSAACSAGQEGLDSAVQRGNAHDKVLDALAAAMVGAGAGLPDLVGLVTSRARMLEHVGDMVGVSPAPG